MTSITVDSIPLRLVDDGFIPLVRGISHTLQLETLVLETCDIGDDSVRLLIENWKPDSALQSLCLARNRIGPDGAQLLLRAAPGHSSFHVLDLTGNKRIGFEGLRKIGEELSAQSHL